MTCICCKKYYGRYMQSCHQSMKFIISQFLQNLHIQNGMETNTNICLAERSMYKHTGKHSHPPKTVILTPKYSINIRCLKRPKNHTHAPSPQSAIFTAKQANAALLFLVKTPHSGIVAKAGEATLRNCGQGERPYIGIVARTEATTL